LLVELVRVLLHAVAAVGRNDAETDAGVVRHRVQMRLPQRARMKRGQRIVVEVCRNECLRRKCPAVG
jgi:hypothetical protein